MSYLDKRYPWSERFGRLSTMKKKMDLPAELGKKSMKGSRALSVKHGTAVPGPWSMRWSESQVKSKMCRLDCVTTRLTFCPFSNLLGSYWGECACTMANVYAWPIYDPLNVPSTLSYVYTA
jgi:hypothetical protein